MTKNNAKMTPLELYLQAGIDPKTSLPTRCGKREDIDCKGNIKRILRIIDEQDAVNRYTWYNLPMNLTSQELERMLYYKGQLCFFYMKGLDQFYFMPYELDGTIDFYGRFNSIHPVPMTSGTEDKNRKAQAQLLSEIKLNCVYGVKLPDELKLDDLENSAVLLHDYTKQLSQTIIPRQQVNDGLLDIMANCIPYMNTSLLANSGVKGMRVSDADASSNVINANATIKNSALNGDLYTPIESTIEIQELTNGDGKKSEEYMQALQSLDNFRLSTYGIDNGGLFDKKAYVNNSQTQLNMGGDVGLVLQDGLSIRQDFCNIVNSIWGLGIWCEPSENITQMDIDGDGLTYERNDDQTSSGVESEDNNNE